MIPRQTINRVHSIYTNEHAADRAIIASLTREIKRLKGDITMSKIVKSTDGKFYLVHDYEELSTEQVTELKENLEADVKLLQDAEAVLSAVPTAEPAPAPAPVVEPPVQVAPTPVVEPPVAPVEVPAVPVEQPAVPAPTIQ